MRDISVQSAEELKLDFLVLLLLRFSPTHFASANAENLANVEDSRKTRFSILVELLVTLPCRWDTLRAATLRFAQQSFPQD